MTRRISVYWEVSADQDSVEAFLFGMREQLLLHCPEVTCDVRAIVSDESNRELQQAMARTTLKAKEARERDDAAMCVYILREFLRIPATEKSTAFEIGASLCAVHGVKTLND